MPEYMNEDLSFLTFLVSPSNCKFRIYLYEPVPMEDCVPYIYVSNGEKKECPFQDELIKITIDNKILSDKINISNDDMNKIFHFININKNVIKQNWFGEISSGHILFNDLIKWEW